MRTSANSHPESVTSHTSSKKPISAKDKLDEINQQLAAVRLKLATLQHDNKSPHKSPPREHGDKHGEKHGKYKSAFHHPKLDLVMGEIVNSPYMTAPMDRYPQETFSVPQKIQELKNKHSAEDIPREELPYDVNEIKHRFLDEVVNYNVSYTAPHMEKDHHHIPPSDDHDSTGKLPKVKTERRTPSANSIRSGSQKSNKKKIASVSTHFSASADAAGFKDALIVDKNTPASSLHQHQQDEAPTPQPAALPSRVKVVRGYTAPTPSLDVFGGREEAEAQYLAAQRVPSANSTQHKSQAKKQVVVPSAASEGNQAAADNSNSNNKRKLSANSLRKKLAAMQREAAAQQSATTDSHEDNTSKNSNKKGGGSGKKQVSQQQQQQQQQGIISHHLAGPPLTQEKKVVILQASQVLANKPASTTTIASNNTSPARKMSNTSKSESKAATAAADSKSVKSTTTATTAANKTPQKQHVKPTTDTATKGRKVAKEDSNRSLSSFSAAHTDNEISSTLPSPNTSTKDTSATAIKDDVNNASFSSISVWQVGDFIEADYHGNGMWFPGKISFVHSDKDPECYDIIYDDGDEEKEVSKEIIKFLASASRKKDPSNAAIIVVTTVGEEEEQGYNEEFVVDTAAAAVAAPSSSSSGTAAAAKEKAAAEQEEAGYAEDFAFDDPPALDTPIITSPPKPDQPPSSSSTAVVAVADGGEENYEEDFVIAPSVPIVPATDASIKKRPKQLWEDDDPLPEPVMQQEDIMALFAAYAQLSFAMSTVVVTR